MKIIYIKENTNDDELIVNKKINKIFKNFSIIFIKKFNIIRKINIANNQLLIIPNLCKKNLNKKLTKILNNESKNSYVVLSNKITKILNLEIKQNVIDGKKAMLFMMPYILDYILNVGDEKTKLETICLYLLTNKNDFTYQIVEYFIDKVKLINIITNNINKYKKFEQILYERGDVITVSNNRKKSLKKAEIIINLDFTKEELYKYNINRNAILINLTDDKINNLVGFNGIIINKIGINIEDDKLKQKFIDKKVYYEFDLLDLYESIINKSNSFVNMIDKIKNDKIVIKKLIGNNGEIDKKEIIKTKKLLTNHKN